jgi:hypothetical protein
VLDEPVYVPGFRWKLWIDDVETGVPARMVALLAPSSNAGTARYQVVEGLRRDDFLLRPEIAPDDIDCDWWRLAEPILVRRRRLLRRSTAKPR